MRETASKVTQHYLEDCNRHPEDMVGDIEEEVNQILMDCNLKSYTEGAERYPVIVINDPECSSDFKLQLPYFTSSLFDWCESIKGFEYWDEVYRSSL